MALKTPTPGLRVFHNSKTAQRFTITVPAGAELTVPVEIAEQMNTESTHAEVDAKEFAAAKKAFTEQAAVEAQAAAEAHHREYHRLPADDKPAKAKKSTTKKAANE